MVSHLCCQQNSSVVNLVGHTYDSCFANVTHSCAHNNNSQTTDSRTSRKSNDNSKLAAAVSSKLEAGNFRAAVQIISSSDTPAPTNEDTLKALRTKHPGPAHDRRTPYDPKDNPRFQALQVSKEDVMKALCTFPLGSSGRPDGITPQHIGTSWRNLQMTASSKHLLTFST